MQYIFHFLKKFKYELDFVRTESISFNLLLHINLWLKDRVLGLSPASTGFPWINYVIIQFLHRYLKPNMRVLEFGAGGSSVFFLKREIILFSIEHEESWLIKVREIIPKKYLKNWTPNLILQSDPNNEIPKVNEYLDPIKLILDSSIEIALIDGRHRVECIKRVIAKIKPGGCLILDNSDRPQYAKAYEILSTWTLEETECITNASDYNTPAAIWFKPKIE